MYRYMFIKGRVCIREKKGRANWCRYNINPATAIVENLEQEKCFQFGLIFLGRNAEIDISSFNYCLSCAANLAKNKGIRLNCAAILYKESCFLFIVKQNPTTA